MDIGYIFSGFLVGIIVGLTGVGGGSLMTPLLMFVFGFKATVAVGTDLLFAALTKSGGVLVHHNRHHSVEWPIVGWLALGSLPAAITTLYLLNHFAKLGKEYTHIMTFTLGVVLILTAIALLMRSWLQAPAEAEHTAAPGRFAYMQVPVTVLTGAILGVLVTLTSVGSGALGTVALLFLYPRLPTLKIVGTDLAHAIPLTAVAGFGHWQLGHVDFTLLGSLMIGSLPGIWIGSHLSAKVPERVLRMSLALLLFLIGLKFVW